MKTLTLQQGSPEWLTHRRTTRNASDAPAMMGASPYVTRAELLRRVATGIEREVDDATQARFDRGHAVEPALRALAEKMLGEDLYPVTGVKDDGYLGASFDGVTLGEDVILEAKQSNAEKRAAMARGEIPPQDYWQIVHQFAVCESAERCLYLVGDGTEEGTSRMTIDRVDISEDLPKLLAGWRQFDADVAAYQPEPAHARHAVGTAPGALPVLSVVARGMVDQTNHVEFRERALSAIAAVNRDLQTDDDFATAELTVKAFKSGEDMLEATRQQILGQMVDVNEVMRTIDEVQAELRRVRLDLDKLVTREKESRKGEIVAAARQSVLAHFAGINATMGEHALQPPSTLAADIGSAIKGKRTLATIKDAADGAAAQAKIDASQRADRIRACVAVLGEFSEHAHLFADRVQLCATKGPEDVRNLARARVAEHQKREEERLEQERERIRKEEADRVEREQREKRAAEEQQTAPPPRIVEAVEAHKRQQFAMGQSEEACEPDKGPSVAAAASGAQVPLVPAAAQIKLGDINDWIAPLAITADGLATLGFRPVAAKGAAKLYAGADFPRICAALAQVIAQAPARAAEKKAA